MASVEFTVPGEPKGKARARTVRIKSGDIKTYTPEQTVLYENLIKTCYLESTIGYEKRHLEGAIRMYIWAYFSVPQSISRKMRSAMIVGEVRPTKKPDMDNIIKVIADALNGIAYRDDSQIISVNCEKYYSDEPRVEVEICEV